MQYSKISEQESEVRLWLLREWIGLRHLQRLALIRVQSARVNIWLNMNLLAWTQLCSTLGTYQPLCVTAKDLATIPFAGLAISCLVSYRELSLSRRTPFDATRPSTP